MARFQPRQTVYILGRYRAKVIECGPLTVTCEVYEGLAPREKAPVTASYRLPLVEAKRAGEEAARAGE
jgi:hypothetical protein